MFFYIHLYYIIIYNILKDQNINYSAYIKLLLIIINTIIFDVLYCICIFYICIPTIEFLKKLIKHDL